MTDYGDEYGFDTIKIRSPDILMCKTQEENITLTSSSVVHWLLKLKKY